MIFEISEWRFKVYDQTGLFGALRSVLTFWMAMNLGALMGCLGKGSRVIR